MDSTCRGEREGLNCKTRRQRGCALKAGRQKQSFRVRSAPRGWGVGCVGVGVFRDFNTISQGAEPQPRKQPAQALWDARGWWVAQTKEKKKKEHTQRHKCYEQK